jgi:hypothetical protein
MDWTIRPTRGFAKGARRKDLKAAYFAVVWGYPAVYFVMGSYSGQEEAFFEAKPVSWSHLLCRFGL